MMAALSRQTRLQTFIALANSKPKRIALLLVLAYIAYRFILKQLLFTPTTRSIKIYQAKQNEKQVPVPVPEQEQEHEKHAEFEETEMKNEENTIENVETDNNEQVEEVKEVEQVLPVPVPVQLEHVEQVQQADLYKYGEMIQEEKEREEVYVQSGMESPKMMEAFDDDMDDMNNMNNKTIHTAQPQPQPQLNNGKVEIKNGLNGLNGHGLKSLNGKIQIRNGSVLYYAAATPQLPQVKNNNNNNNSMDIKNGLSVSPHIGEEEYFAVVDLQENRAETKEKYDKLEQYEYEQVIVEYDEYEYGTYNNEYDEYDEHKKSDESMFASDNLQIFLMIIFVCFVVKLISNVFVSVLFCLNIPFLICVLVYSVVCSFVYLFT